MKKVKIITVALFFVLLVIPIITFNWKENVVSEIDNRNLTNNPFGDNYVSDGETDLSGALEDYVQDRIGLRSEMISAYTLLYDRVFGEMVHPSYEYGKDGYVFGKVSYIEFGEYQLAFADMIKNIQDYCTERDIPFVFMFEPNKTTVLQNELADGINFNNNWVQDFFKALDERRINYVDNTGLLIEKVEAGEDVFNKKYDPGHWNDLGAFYGVNNVLESLQEFFPTLHINEKEEYEISEKLNTKIDLLAIPIHEYAPVFTPKDEVEDYTDEYQDELEINSQHRNFSFIVNGKRKEEGLPKALVFQGSYMNGIGSKFFQNSFGEYVAVHNYENVINFDYYFNIFQPDCVIFEVTEWTINPSYFNYEKMLDMELNPALEEYRNFDERMHNIEECQIELERGEQLTAVSIQGLPEDVKYAYIRTQEGTVFDLKINQTENGNKSYNVTVDNDIADFNNMEIVTVNESNVCKEVYK